MAQNKEDKIELQEAKETLKIDINLTRAMLISFGFLALLVRILFEVSIPVPVLLLLLAWFLLYLPYPYLLKKKKSSSGVYNLYFKFVICDLLFLTAIIHYIGAGEWFGVIFYMLTLGLSGIVLPKGKSLLLSFITVFLYSGLILMEYFGVLPHRPLFVLRPGLYQEPGYIFSQILVLIAFFFFTGETAGTFSNRLREKRKQLIREREKTKKALEQVEEAKKVLEIKVKARTRELRELAQKREEIIKQRTKELQEKVKELERFQKMAVGRELKMVELKKKIEKLENR